MNFYVRYSSAANLNKQFINYYKRYAYITELFNNTNSFDTTLAGRLFTVGHPDEGPTAFNRTVLNTYVTEGTLGNYKFYQGRVIYSDPSSQYGTIYKSDWNSYGWDTSSISAFKDDLTGYFIGSMNNVNNTSSYKIRFGADFKDLDYNIVIYWGKPMEDGVPGAQDIIIPDLWIGNDPLADVVVSG